MGLKASSDVKGTLGTFNPVPFACSNGNFIERRRSGMSAGMTNGGRDRLAASALRDIPLHRLTLGREKRQRVGIHVRLFGRLSIPCGGLARRVFNDRPL